MKTKFKGTNNDYKKILNLIETSLSILHDTGLSINDMCYFGIDATTREQELKIYDQIKIKLKEVETILNESINT